MSEPTAYFRFNDDGSFAPTSHSRGPWNPDHCHAGPPTALVARACEHALEGTTHSLVRLTVELGRPVPMAGFTVEASLRRSGRATSIIDAALIDLDGVECVRATATAIRGSESFRYPTADERPARLGEAVDGDFPMSSFMKKQTGFSRSVAVRYPPEQAPTPGPTTVWMRSVPIVEGEVASPFQRICPLADCGNAFSRNAEPSEVSFINPDLTIVLHRSPVGEWLGSESTSQWQPGGIGMSSAVLFDDQGLIGHALQSLLLQPTS